MSDLYCPDHPDLPAVGSCETCGREVCEECLKDAAAPEEYECPDCGGYGAALYDEDYSGTEDVEEAPL